MSSASFASSLWLSVALAIGTADRTRLSRRPDYSVLAFLMAFGLFENPAGGRSQGFHPGVLPGYEDGPPPRAGMIPGEVTRIDSC